LPCVAIDHGVWPTLSTHMQAVWLGEALGDTLLLFDEASGKYEVWPVRRTKGRTIPRPGQLPLAAGSWPAMVGTTLVHAGGATLLALRPAQGEYELLMIDSTALVLPTTPSLTAPPPEITCGRLAAGSITAAPAFTFDTPAAAAPVTDAASSANTIIASSAAANNHADTAGPCAFSYHAPTYLGDDLLLSVEPSSGRYCVLRLSRERPQMAALAHVGGGDLSRLKCEASSCGSCSALPGCGWCSATNTCMQGNEQGACGGSCREHWTFGYCADWPCSHHHTCDDCLAAEVCGWCSSSRTCMAGSDVQPLQLRCTSGYRYQSCSSRLANATIVTA